MAPEVKTWRSQAKGARQRRWSRVLRAMIAHLDILAGDSLLGGMVGLGWGRRFWRSGSVGCFGILRCAQDDSKNGQRQQQKQIPPLRCGMTTKKAGNSHSNGNSNNGNSNSRF